MKKKKIISIIIIASIAILFMIAAILVASFGKEIIVTQLEKNLKMKVNIESVSLSFPLCVKIEKPEVGDLFRAEEISFSPSIIGFFAGKIVLSRLSISGPVINLVQSSEGKLNLPRFKEGGRQPPIFATGIRVKKGRVNFKDEKILSQGFIVSLGNIDAVISKVMLPPTSLKVKFDGSAFILNNESQEIGNINCHGWIDFGSKDMDGMFELKNLEAVYFSPYYGDFISKKKLISAKLDFKSQLKAQDDGLDIVSSLRLYGIKYAPEEQAQENTMPVLDLSKNALDLFTDREGNLNLDFEIRTKLDNPAITSEELKKTILKAAARNLANQRPEDVIEKISNTVQQFKDFGKQMESIFKKKKD